MSASLSALGLDAHRPEEVISVVEFLKSIDQKAKPLLTSNSEKSSRASSSNGSKEGIEVSREQQKAHPNPRRTLKKRLSAQDLLMSVRHRLDVSRPESPIGFQEEFHSLETFEDNEAFRKTMTVPANLGRNADKK